MKDVARFRPVFLAMGCVACSLVLWFASAAVADDAPRTPKPFSAGDLAEGPMPASALVREDKANGTRVYLSEVGAVHVTAAFAEHGDADGYTALRDALTLARAQEHALPADGPPWMFLPFGPFGGALVHPRGTFILMGQDTLKRVERSDRDAVAERKAVRDATKAFLDALENSASTTSWVRGAMREVLELLHEAPGDPSEAELDPCFARRVIASEGWLERVSPGVDSEVRRKLADAVRASLALSVGVRFSDGKRSIALLGNAWEQMGLHLKLGKSSVLLAKLPKPMQSMSRWKALGQSQVLYLLEADADPVADPACVARAPVTMLQWGGRALASYSRKKNELGFDLTLWRQAFPYYGGTAVSHAWPAHIPVHGMDGVLHGIAVPRGFLKPVADDSHEEYERFLDDAAKMLHKPAYLDLLQQYFVRYTRDSPDVTVPIMLGSTSYRGDIHQTVEQTLHTCTGGICRGDCDDFAELLQDIVRRQGHLAYVAGVPGHVATVWAVHHRKKDQWRVYVFQSGPSHEFRAGTLNEGLRKAFLKLDPDAPFDDTSLEIMLRFGGGNTRSSFGLPARIFRDGPYATTLIDVQRDWHRSTLHGAATKMQALIDGGDDSLGSLNEIAAIYDAMDVHGKAVEYDRKALTKRLAPETRLIKTVDLLANLVEAKRTDEAKELLDRVLAEEMPKFAADSGLRILYILLGLADDVIEDDPLMARRVVHALLHQRVASIEASVAELLDPARDAKRWTEHKQQDALHSLADDIAWTAISLVRETRGLPDPNGEMKAILRPVDTWLERHAMDERDEAEDQNIAWAQRALRFEAADPGFVDTVLATTPPTQAAAPEGLTGKAYARSVARYTRASTWFWSNAIIDHVTQRKTPIDRKHLEILEGGMRAAHVLSTKLDMEGPATARLQARARLYLALAREDKAALRTSLKAIAAQDDRRNTLRAAYAVCFAARYASLDWWKTILDVWGEAFDGDEHWLQFAWSARNDGMRAHALVAADAAVKHVPEDDAIKAEAAMFHKALGQGGR